MFAPNNLQLLQQLFGGVRREAYRYGYAAGSLAPGLTWHFQFGLTEGLSDGHYCIILIEDAGKT